MPALELTRLPTPAGRLYTVEALCLMFGKSPDALRMMLKRYGAKLSEPKYLQLDRRSHRMYRVLTERDVVTLRRIVRPIYVRRKTQ